MKKLNEIDSRYWEVADIYQFNQLGDLYNVKTNRKIKTIDTTKGYSKRCMLMKNNGINSSFGAYDINKAIRQYVAWNKVD